MTDQPKSVTSFSDSELLARGFSPLPSLDRICPDCERPVECWEDRVGHRCAFVRVAVAPGEGPRVTPHYALCRFKILFQHARVEKTAKPWRDG
jgi:hypothetical protein